MLGKVEVINALEMYVEGGPRVRNYETVARTIIRALENHRPLGYVTYGNPMSYDRVAQNLVLYAKESDCALQIVPGISSVDTVLCDLMVDMAPAIQIFEASWFFACEMNPNITAPLLLMQVGFFGSLRTHYSVRSDGRSLSELIEYLCRFYPPDHSVSLVRSTGHESQPTAIRGSALKELITATAEELSGSSLYVPSVEAPRPNVEVITRMTNT
jgi:uncharacterized protein YabN with tetrapyrrole methylase and pyrophosphatase domain